MVIDLKTDGNGSVFVTQIIFISELFTPKHPASHQILIYQCQLCCFKIGISYG